ncbi:Major Facilitator Superfamily [Popillia japonica]|uniref:Major Facilitator Superfamily n=1 Tax=Popillia japonica TaxID=7064 RepID=A0AAW1M2Q7_POPJA
MAGLLQTSFILSYMVFAPLFGYLGDRYSRKLIMALGVALWSVTTLLGSFMNNFGWFVVFRALVGIGEASYSTIAPTIISDLFIKGVRSKMLAFFYFAIPVGSGLGYIVGSETAKALGSWQWALRVTPALGLVAVILLLVVLKDPERGASEGSGHLATTPWKEDLKDLGRNPSFILSSAGFTCVAFVAGALAWWGPKFIAMGIALQRDDGVQQNDVAYKFGLISMASGLLGVPAGSFLAQRLRHAFARIDPHICAGGLLLSAPMIFMALITAAYSDAVCYTFVFFGEFFLNLTWSIVADILLYVVLPTRRSTAEGVQLLVSHALGDAGSPYLIGVISDWLASVMKSSSVAVDVIATNSSKPLAAAVTSSVSQENALIEFRALQYALFTTCFVEILGGLFFLINALYIVKDRLKVERAVKTEVVFVHNSLQQSMRKLVTQLS